MSRFIRYGIKLFFMSLLIFLYSQGPAVSETGCFDNFSTVTGDYERCNPDWKPQWSPNNLQEAEPYDSGVPGSGFVVVKFEGGQPPYTWQISGAGFWLDDQYTQTTKTTDTFSTTIYADSSACGSAEISVTDWCGKQETGYVRSTEGVWVQKSEYDGTCRMPGYFTYEWTCFGTGDTDCFELIQGNKRQFQRIYNTWSDAGDCENLGGTCDQKCTDYGLPCLNDIPCLDCLNSDKVPCDDFTYEGTIRCNCVMYLQYFEWECGY